MKIVIVANFLPEHGLDLIVFEKLLKMGTAMRTTKKMRKLFSETKEVLRDGMTVFHKTIQQRLKVVDDKKGPAYTGNEFKDDEISLSYAIHEYNEGKLTILS